MRDELRPRRHHGQAEDGRGGEAEGQHPFLGGRGDPEKAEDEDEDGQVVKGQGLLQQVAGRVQGGRGGAARDRDGDAQAECGGDGGGGLWERMDGMDGMDGGWGE